MLIDLLVELDDDQRMIRDLAKEIAQKEISPQSIEIDASKQIPDGIFKTLKEACVFGVGIPEEYGGLGFNLFERVLVAEQLGAADLSVAAVFGQTSGLFAKPIMNFGTSEQKQSFLPKIAAGDYFGCYALSEADAGSNPLEMKARYEMKGDAFILNGEKMWVTGAPISRYAIVFARQKGTSGKEGISAFIVEKSSNPQEGFVAGSPIDKDSIKGSKTSPITLQDTAIPVSGLLGDEGKGMYIAMNTLQTGRLEVSAQSLGAAQSALDISIAYAHERKQGGRPIYGYQAVSHRLAKAQTDLDHARLLVYMTARLFDAKDKQFLRTPEAMRLASEAKYFSTTAAWNAADAACLTLGGYGNAQEYGLAQKRRDLDVWRTFEGTNDIQLETIAKILSQQR